LQSVIFIKNKFKQGKNTGIMAIMPMAEKKASGVSFYQKNTVGLIKLSYLPTNRCHS